MEHGISRKTFYALRSRAVRDGQAAVLEPLSRRPHSSPTRIDDEVKKQAVQVRAALEVSGLDYGPISVHDKMKAMGLAAPSIAALARIFREAGVARAEPKKRPRSSWRRFVYPAPNACWQMDATEYVLTRGRKCVIFQLEDDHSRLAIASHVAGGETTAAAIAVFDKGVAAHGVPQRLLTDNGSAVNPSRRGYHGQLVAHVSALGVKAITGKPHKPTTQGKNERFHRTLFQWLDKQPLAVSIPQLQALVDQFDTMYNEQRPHQGLPGRITPRQAWDATEPAEPPRPITTANQPLVEQAPNPPRPRRIVTGEQMRTVANNGTISIHNVMFHVSMAHAGQQVRVLVEHIAVMFIDSNGEILAEHYWPPVGTRYVRKQPHPRTPNPSPMS